jgi:polyhydroxybutyrate depolymerase
LDFLGNRNWNTFGPRGSGVDDVAFLSALIDSLALRYRLDPDRIYSTGMSNGGFMSYELACQLSNRIAAIGSVTGSMIASRLSTCTPSRPVPVIEIHGTADNTVPYDGGTILNFVPVPTLLARWVQINGCNPAPVITPVANTNTTDGSTAERQCGVGAATARGGALPHHRGRPHLARLRFHNGVTNRDSTPAGVWRFLRPFRLRRLPLTTPAGQRVPSLALYPNPTATYSLFEVVLLCSPPMPRCFSIQGQR